MSKSKFSRLTSIPHYNKNSVKVNKVSEKLKLIKSENHGSNEDKINISLEVLDRDNELFNLGGTTIDWFISMLDTLKHLTTITKKQLFNEFYSKYDPHHYNGNINYKDEYLFNEQIRDEAYQLRITKGKGRIHGFFVGNTYYIRFFDSQHNMYDSEGYGTVTICDFPKNSYDLLCIENEQLRNSLTEEKKKNDHNSELVCGCCIGCNVIDKRDNKKIIDKFEL